MHNNNSRPWPTSGAEVVALREQAVLTQTELAARMQIGQSALSKIEASTKPPSRLMIERLGAALGMRFTVG